MSPSLTRLEEYSSPEGMVRLKVSSNGRFCLDKEKGGWVYKDCQNWALNVPTTLTYAEFMFKLSEKHTSVSVKWQLPGEDLDPDGLVSISDDEDLKEMYEEFFRALKLPGTPIKTFRLRVVLFPADEEVLTPEEIADGVSGDGWFRTESGRVLTRDTSISRGLSRSTTEKGTVNSNASSLSGPPSVVTDAAWEAGFRAGQEAAAWAAEEEDEEGLWAGDAEGEEQFVWQGNLSHKLAVVATSPQQPGAFHKPLPLDSSPLSGALSVVLSGNPAPCGDASHYYTQDPWMETGPEADAPLVNRGSCARQLPSHISAFGDCGGGEQEEEVGHGEQLGDASGAPELRLPSHVSAFGDCVDAELHHQVMNALAVTAAALGEEVGYAHGIVPPGLPSVVVPQTGFLDPQPGSACVLNAQKPAHGPRQLRAGACGGSDSHGGGAERRPLVRDGSGSSSAASMAHYIAEVHRVPREEVRVLGHIGEGAFGEVSLAMSSMFGKVAVKWLKPNRVNRHLATFWREAETLATVNHPNVLRFYGVVVECHNDPSVIGIITEYMRGGSLSQLLRSGIGFLPLNLRAEIALQVVKGLSYLHEMRVVHFDLKPDNLLVDGTFEGSGRWVVADFGLSKHKNNNFVSDVRDLRGTLPYMAPELVSDPDHVDEKADVWSLGMVLWEMLTLEVPFQQLTPQQIIAGLMAGSLRPEIPDWCEPSWCALMEACLDVTPAARPPLKDLVRQLEAILEYA